MDFDKVRKNLDNRVKIETLDKKTFVAKRDFLVTSPVIQTSFEECPVRFNEKSGMPLTSEEYLALTQLKDKSTASMSLKCLGTMALAAHKLELPDSDFFLKNIIDQLAKAKQLTKFMQDKEFRKKTTNNSQLDRLIVQKIITDY